MPYSKCFNCKRRLDVPNQGHWKYCQVCLTIRKKNKLIKQVESFIEFLKQN